MHFWTLGLWHLTSYTDSISDVLIALHHFPGRNFFITFHNCNMDLKKKKPTTLKLTQKDPWNQDFEAFEV